MNGRRSKLTGVAHYRFRLKILETEAPIGRAVRLPGLLQTLSTPQILPAMVIH
jgi:hypothetical protein